MDSNESKRNASADYESPKDSQSTKLRIENPFIAFRRFADEAISNALQQIIGLPSAVTKQLEGALPGLEKIRTDNARSREESRKGYQKEPLIPAEEAPQDLIEELRRHREHHRKRWDHIKEAIQQGPDAPYTSSMSNDDRERMASRAAGYTPLLQNGSIRQGDAHNGSANSFVDVFFGDSGMLGPIMAPLEAALFCKFNTNLSSDINYLPYLLLSPYSPLFLSNRMFHHSDKYVEEAPFPYCDAFEDLLLASRGKEMVSLEERRQRQSQYPARAQDFGLAMTWLQRLQSRGLLEEAHRADEQYEEDDGTELSMYQRFLSSAFSKVPPQMNEERNETPKEAAPIQDEKLDQEPALSIGGILSTLTRTESKRYPDGRVETKVVLIKRFADGGETRTETVHTNHEGTKSAEENFEDGKQTGKDEKKGWFWN